MKRQYFFLLFLILGILFSTAKAQEYVVYSVTGNAKLVCGKSSSTIAIRQKLNKESIVRLSAGDKIVLIDQSAKKQYTLSTKGTFSVEKLIANSNNSVKSLSDMYLSFLMKQINGKGVLTSRIAVDDAFSSIERVTPDSVFSDVPAAPLDTISQ